MYVNIDTKGQKLCNFAKIPFMVLKVILSSVREFTHVFLLRKLMHVETKKYIQKLHDVSFYGITCLTLIVNSAATEYLNKICILFTVEESRFSYRINMNSYIILQNYYLYRRLT
jgi:hypothetical protein